jgi:hypothetical protein
VHGHADKKAELGRPVLEDPGRSRTLSVQHVPRVEAAFSFQQKQATEFRPLLRMQTLHEG